MLSNMVMVSIIVPVYNVAPYLKRCVDTIIVQTCSNIEIILIDDGSTDGCTAICDELAKEDERIVVIHQKNAGLSAARNAGLDIAKGEFVVFVDSDDWIHPRYVEKLLDDMQVHQCKMAIGEMRRCQNMESFDEMTGHSIKILREEAIPRMLKGEWISAWGKMYHCSLFDRVRFPVGRNNEDYAILIYLFEQCEKVCYTKDVIYYYYLREGSITQAVLNDHSFDEVVNGKEVWDYCCGRYPQWSGLALFNLTASIIKLTGKCVIENRYMDKYDEMKALFLSHKEDILNNADLSLKYKVFLWALLMGKPVHRMLMTLYNNK